MPRFLAIAAAVVLTALAASPASAERTDFSAKFTTQTANAPSGLGVHIYFHAPGDPTGKPSPLRSAVLRFPEGTRFDSAAAPQCTASDAELTVLGSSACPAASQLTQGAFSAITGFGAPIDPLAGDLHVFNAPGQIIEVITVPGTPASPAFDRLTIAGSTLTAHPPAAPGGPPDGQSSVKSIDYAMPPHVAAGRSFLTTPPTCATGIWRTTATFGFADGTSDTVTSASPCTLPPAARPKPPGRPHHARHRKHRRR